MAFKVEVSTVSTCENGCVYCPSVYKDMQVKSRKKFMTLEDAKLYFSRFPRPLEVYFGGHSDPMKAPEIYDIVKYLLENDVFVFMLTTLNNVDISIVRKVFSLKGLHARIHIPDNNGYTKMKVTDSLLKNYKIAVRSIGINKGEITACCWGTIPEEVKGIFEGIYIENDMRNLCDFGGNVKHEWFKPHFITGPIKCKRESMCTHLLPDGSLSVCETDWALNHIIGDLNNETYEEILNGDKYRNYLNILNSETDDCVCRHCTDAINV